MTPQEFAALRDLPNKKITGDVAFRERKKSNDPVRYNTQSEAKIENSLGYRLVLVATYYPDEPALTFNVHMGSSKSTICRLDINARLHRKAGRTHKHEPKEEADIPANLPFAYARPDYEGMGEDPKAAWVKFCQEAKITHEGHLLLPGEEPPHGL